MLVGANACSQKIAGAETGVEAGFGTAKHVEEGLLLAVTRTSTCMAVSNLSCPRPVPCPSLPPSICGTHTWKGEGVECVRHTAWHTVLRQPGSRHYTARNMQAA